MTITVTVLPRNERTKFRFLGLPVNWIFNPSADPQVRVQATFRTLGEFSAAINRINREHQGFLEKNRATFFECIARYSHILRGIRVKFDDSMQNCQDLLIVCGKKSKLLEPALLYSMATGKNAEAANIIFNDKQLALLVAEQANSVKKIVSIFSKMIDDKIGDNQVIPFNKKITQAILNHFSRNENSRELFLKALLSPASTALRKRLNTDVGESQLLGFLKKSIRPISKRTGLAFLQDEIAKLLGDNKKESKDIIKESKDIIFDLFLHRSPGFFTKVFPDVSNIELLKEKFSNPQQNKEKAFFGLLCFHREMRLSNRRTFRGRVNSVLDVVINHVTTPALLDNPDMEFLLRYVFTNPELRQKLRSRYIPWFVTRRAEKIGKFNSFVAKYDLTKQLIPVSSETHQVERDDGMVEVRENEQTPGVLPSSQANKLALLEDGKEEADALNPIVPKQRETQKLGEDNAELAKKVNELEERIRVYEGVIASQVDDIKQSKGPPSKVQAPSVSMLQPDAAVLSPPDLVKNTDDRSLSAAQLVQELRRENQELRRENQELRRENQELRRENQESIRLLEELYANNPVPVTESRAAFFAPPVANEKTQGSKSAKEQQLLTALFGGVSARRGAISSPPNSTEFSSAPNSTELSSEALTQPQQGSENTRSSAQPLPAAAPLPAATPPRSLATLLRDTVVRSGDDKPSPPPSASWGDLAPVNSSTAIEPVAVAEEPAKPPVVESLSVKERAAALQELLQFKPKGP